MFSATSPLYNRFAGLMCDLIDYAEETTLPFMRRCYNRLSPGTIALLVFLPAILTNPYLLRVSYYLSMGCAYAVVGAVCFAYYVGMCYIGLAACRWLQQSLFPGRVDPAIAGPVNCGPEHPTVAESWELSHPVEPVDSLELTDPEWVEYASRFAALEPTLICANEGKSDPAPADPLSRVYDRTPDTEPMGPPAPYYGSDLPASAHAPSQYTPHASEIPAGGKDGPLSAVILPDIDLSVPCPVCAGVLPDHVGPCPMSAPQAAQDASGQAETAGSPPETDEASSVDSQATHIGRPVPNPVKGRGAVKYRAYTGQDLKPGEFLCRKEGRKYIPVN